LTRVVPSAKDPSMIERCDIDLSPGTHISPFKDFAPATVLFCKGCLLIIVFLFIGCPRSTPHVPRPGF